MSSLVHLGFAVILFIISYGIMFVTTAAILGMFFSAMDNFTITNTLYLQAYTDLLGVVAFLIPLVPTIGIFIFVVKVLLVASVRGRD